MDQHQPLPLLKLDGENWAVWKFQTSVILRSRGLYDIVTGENLKPDSGTADIEKWIKGDCKAQEIIVTRVEPGPMTHLLSCETACEMWTKLKSVFDKESVVSVHLLQQKLFSLEFADQSVSTYISQLEEIQSKLKQAGEELSEKMLITKILMSLPVRFKHFRSAWESVASPNQTLSELTSRLLIEEERLKSEENTTALATFSRVEAAHVPVFKAKECLFCHKKGHTVNNCFKKQNSDNKGESRRCFYCKQPGHVIANCQQRKQKDDRGEFDLSDLAVNDWCMDTGASEHMCHDKSFFSQLVPSDLSRKVKVGNGNLLNVLGVGTVHLWADTGNCLLETNLSNVLYVPELKCNLFSVGCALDKGYTMTSERKNQLYKMKFVYKVNCKSVSKTKPIENLFFECKVAENVESLSVWHSKLAHQNIAHVKQVLKRNKIVFSNEKLESTCIKCLSRKQHSFPYPLSHSRSTDLLELVHADLCGPMETSSIGGSRYFLLI